MSAFVSPTPLHAFVVHVAPKRLCVQQPRKRPHAVRWKSAVSQTTWSSHSSSALDHSNAPDSQAARYIDLRTMKVVSAEQAHITPVSETFTGFEALRNYFPLFDDPSNFQRLRQLLFTSDTLSLSEPQKDVVFALLSRHSVVYPNASFEEKQALFLDLVMRCRLWKESVIYCTSSRRAAQSMFTSLCSQLGSERRHEVLFHFGDGLPHRIDGSTSLEDPIRAIITSPAVLRSETLNNPSNPWLEKSSVIFLDNVNERSLVKSEEILLSLPSRFLVCLFSSHLSRSELELLPLWIETIQNTTSLIPPSYSSFLNRIDRPQNLPLLRAFVYNAATHEFPVQLSLNILKSLVQQEIDHPNSTTAPEYSQSFLHGVSQIGTESPSKLLFRSAEEAAYADAAALIVADAKLVENVMRSKNRKHSRSRRKERTASSRAASRRRRESAFSESMLLPAMVVIKGCSETLQAAHAIQSALGDEVSLLWDEDSQEDVCNCIDAFKDTHGTQLTSLDVEVFELARIGIGVVHERYTPSVRLLVEELFRGGLLPVVFVDSHLGTEELSVFPSSKSILVDSSIVALCDDETKGLISASAIASLAGRPGKDDVGNLIVLWYDDSVDDEMAGREIASTLLVPFLTANPIDTKSSNSTNDIDNFKQPFGGNPLNFEARRGLQSAITSSYDAVLRSLRRFGLDGCKFIFEYTLGSFKGWLRRAALHATLEKLIIDKRAIDERLDKEDWDSISDYERKSAKVNEVRRILRAMTAKIDSVVQRTILQDLKACRPGRLIRVRCHIKSDNGDSTGPGLLLGAVSSKLSDTLSGNRKDGEKGDSQDLQLLPTDAKNTGSSVVGVFVTVIDQERDGKRICNLDSRHLVVCITTDGTWTMTPVQDVDAIAAEEEELVANVDLLMVPHPGTFDLDPESEWAKCVPVDDGERVSVQRVSDELITRITSDHKTKLVPTKIPEFESHKAHMQQVETAYRESEWYGKDDLVVELRRLRRRGVEIGDEIAVLEKRKGRFEEGMSEHHDDCRSLQTALMAVLEDCHALSYVSEVDAELTPIGALASVLPCEYPVFAAACLCLTDDMDSLSASELAAFVAVLACSEVSWAGEKIDNVKLNEDDDDEPIDLSSVSRKSDYVDEPLFEDETDRNETNDARFVRELLPSSVADMIVEVRQALHQLHKRHLTECQATERVWVNEIVPISLNTQMGHAAKSFVEGESWARVCENLGNKGTLAVEELRKIRGIVEFIWRDEKYSEFPDSVKDLAKRTYDTMSRWPIQDNHIMFDLIENGVVERTWNGNTYERWWRSMRDELNGSPPSTLDSKNVTQISNGSENDIESVIADSVDEN